MGAVVYRLWAMSLQASILIVIVLAVRFFLRKYPRIYSYCLWALVGIRLLCPVWVESPFSLQPDLSGYSVRMEAATNDGMGQTDAFSPQGGNGDINVFGGELQGVTTDAENAEVNFPYGEGELPFGENQDLHGKEDDAEVSSGKFGFGTYVKKALEALSGQSGLGANLKKESEKGNGLESGLFDREFGRLLSLIYLIGVAGMLLFHLGQYLWVRHKVSTAVREKGNVWLCDKIASPFVMGIVFPKIYLPYKVSGGEKKHVLRHERTHIKHHDPLIRVVGTLCVCLHWWNPLVWLAVYLMDQDMEMFCDETVLRRASLEERKDYAETLLSFAERGSGLGTGLAFGESHTQKRVKNIMKKRKRSLLVVCLVVVLAVFCVVALMTVPRVDSENGKGNSLENLAETEPVLSEESGMASGAPDEDMAEGITQGMLSDAGLSWLMEICPGIPDFASEGEMGADFWEDYLFGTYTSDFDREQVSRYSEQYGFDIPYIRVSFSEADETIRQVFGKNLSEYGISPEMLGAGGSNLLYEDGFLLIAASDSPIFQFVPENVTTADGMTELSLLKTVEEEVASHVILHLLPAENEHGFILSGKQESQIPQTPEGQVLEGQSFEVEMNPYGTVTFAAYAPDTANSPYADVTFKLLQNGQEIYSFPLKGTGVRQDQSVFQEMAAVAFPDLNGDGYTDVVTIANYEHESGPVPSQIRIFTYNPGGYFLEELYLEDAYNFSHEEKTIADIEAFATMRENQDYFVRTSIYGRWVIHDYKLPGIYALSQEEIDSLVGARLEYGITSLWTNVDGENNTVTGYERNMVTAQELEADYKISRDALGIAEDNLVYYQVNAEKESLFGCFFYLVDEEHALVYYEGVFFEAVRE